MALVNIRKALQQARTMGIEVKEKGGRVHLVDPLDPLHPFDCNGPGRTKDAPYKLEQFLTHARERRSLAKLKAKTEANAVQPTTAKVVVQKSAAVGKTESPIRFTLVEPVAPAQEAQSMSTTKKKSMPFIYTDIVMDYLFAWVERNGWRRGSGIRLYTTMEASRPELLTDARGTKVSESALTQYVSSRVMPVIEARLRVAAETAPTKTVMVTAPPEDATDVVALREENANLKRLIERDSACARLAGTAHQIISELLNAGDVDTLTSLIELARR